MTDRVVSTITTERLTLRPWTVDDAEHYLDILGRPEVVEWLDMEPIPDVHIAREKIEQVQLLASERVPTSRAIVPNKIGHPVGSVVLATFGEGEPEVHLGWHLHPDQVGNGWATEAARAVLAEALANGHPRVWANMWSHNEPSAAICRRLGMTHLGVIDDPWYGNIEYPTSRYFCIENPDAADGLSPTDVLADRMSRVELKPAVFHPPA